LNFLPHDNTPSSPSHFLTTGWLVAEKFDQAITDYTSGLALKTELLPLSSRQLAEVHYKLSIALDLTAGRLADAIHHAQRALESIEARLVELQAGLAGKLPPLTEPEPSDAKDHEEGKGKGKQVALVPDELVQNRSQAQIEAEIKELGELKQDLALKVMFCSLCFWFLHPAR
jgi:HAT1-interacting factor 1